MQRRVMKDGTVVDHIPGEVVSVKLKDSNGRARLPVHLWSLSRGECFVKAVDIDNDNHFVPKGEDCICAIVDESPHLDWAYGVARYYKHIFYDNINKDTMVMKYIPTKEQALQLLPFLI